MDLESLAWRSMSRADLAGFIEQLADSYVEERDSWENVSIEGFLRAGAAWLTDMDGYFGNIDRPVPESPTWELIAMILLAARSYE